MRVLLVVVLLAFAGCGGDSDDDSKTVVAAFYPLAWAAEEVVPEGTAVVNLTPPGVEPHDVELTPSDVELVRDAHLIVYLAGGFQPALEEGVASRDGATLELLYGEPDPHIWLDPVRFARAVADIAHTVGDIESARPALRQLERLHRDYRNGLADCDRRTIVTTHAAFGQLARRYGLTEVSLAGRSPEAEPGPRELEQLIDDVRASGATTVFAEPLVSDRVAQTVALETGADVAVLDPLEGLSDDRLAAGEDYLSVMRANLAALQKALGCR